ncbi:MAG TPA: AAA family ATPase [Paracoccaceae bacterium]|nr:AAA family ATPase [Paracoccaceae bacterium]HMO73218.1 AAA family ATPase [Paracoccaceae bacterium]
MDPRRNPFVPGAGVRPPEFAGREQLIEQASIAFDRILNGLHSNSFMLLGLRGVGKTVLLNALHETAKAKGFETLRLEVPDNSGGHLARMLVPGLNVILQRLSLYAAATEGIRRAATALRNFAAVFKVEYEGFSLGATEALAEGGSGILEADLPDLLRMVAEAAAAKGRALGLFIDEVQYLSKPELSALARALHDAAQSGYRLIVVGAGLPQLAALVGEAKSYAERLIEFREVGPLDPDAARNALQLPARRMGAEFTEAALDRIVGDTERYAYFLQTWAKFAWDTADASPVTEQSVTASLPAILTNLDQSFFRVRFDRCTQTEQRYLRAMAELGPGPHRTGDIAAQLGVGSNQIAPVRRSLIDSGMIYSQRHGETAFTVPLFDQFLKRAIPVLERHTPKRRRKTE